MQRRRFNLPPLDLIQGFEAAARHLSFTKAASELFITQSAVSRQIRGLEDHLGVTLFERQHRALALTPQGRELYRAATDLLERLQNVTDRLRMDRDAPHLTVTTTSGFASLWLIPRLGRFTALYPDVDVRISASYKAVNLERSLVDVAVRYCREDAPPEGAIRLFGEELLPVCSPALQREGAAPLRSLSDLERHTLLHLSEAAGHLDWGTWLAAEGCTDLKPAASMRFDSYEQMIQAALSGQGVALGIRRLVQHLIDGGQLVAPFDKSIFSTRAYYVIPSATTGARPHVKAFVDWLVAEASAAFPKAARVGLSSPPPAARSAGARRPARSKP
ncbi:MAG: transcriptional regulator GcvA [Hyphomicrobiaceae bacterium]|nr:MAG: transcriptional regulator GcvA [Hyphomicrobiaceae bacterium]